jgi:hypothetical protein
MAHARTSTQARLEDRASRGAVAEA